MAVNHYMQEAVVLAIPSVGYRLGILSQSVFHSQGDPGEEGAYTGAFSTFLWFSGHSCKFNGEGSFQFLA